MGLELIKALHDEHNDLHLAAAVCKSGSPVIGQDAGELVGVGTLNVPVEAGLSADRFDLLIDFSQVEASLEYLEFCRRHNKAMVIGTTGFDEQQKSLIQRAAQTIPIVFAPNMSVGVNLCFHLLQQAAAVMGADSDIEIIETHHRNKLDAPSGTALRMGEVVAQELGRDLSDCAVYGREGISAVRDSATIGFSSIRAGDVIGDHTVMFASAGERLEITHKSSSRQTYANGALRAAQWLNGRAAGLYDMLDVLNLEKR